MPSEISLTSIYPATSQPGRTKQANETAHGSEAEASKTEATCTADADAIPGSGRFQLHFLSSDFPVESGRKSMAFELSRLQI